MVTAVITDSNYWFEPFWVMLVSPGNPNGERRRIKVEVHHVFPNSDLIFTVPFKTSSVVMSDAFPPGTESFAGDVLDETVQLWLSRNSQALIFSHGT
ncbi:major facilitator superfamily transporter [Seiridium cupressi]